MVCAFAAAAAPAKAANETAAEVRLAAAGNDQTLWVVLADERAEDGEPLLRFCFGDRQRGGLIRSPVLLPDRLGGMAALGANRDGLLVIYDDGTSGQFRTGDARAGPRWPSSRPPLAFAGDAAGPLFFAVAEGSSVILPATRPTATADRWRPGSSSAGLEGGSRGTDSSRERKRPDGLAVGDAPALPTTTIEPGVVLLRLRHRLWDVVSRLPAEAAGEFWLSARDGRAHLFWQKARGKPIESCTLAAGQWSGPERIENSAGAVAFWACADEVGPLLVLAEAPNAETGSCTLRVAWRKDGRWYSGSRLRDETGTVQVDPRKTAVTLARTKLAVVERIESDGLRLGECALEGDRTVRWSRVVATGAGPELSSPPEWAGWLEALAVIAAVTAIVWYRQSALAQPAILPADLAPAAPGRRLAGLALDLAPALLVTLPMWRERLADVTIIVPRVTDPAAGQRWLAAQTMMPVYVTLLIHAAYCVLFEGLTGTTPGKGLVGCRVVADGGGRPSAGQVLVRNALRVPELAMILMTIATLFMVLVLSRRRQRLGDLLAGTLVVCRQPPMARPVGTRSEPTGEEAESDSGSKRDSESNESG